MKALNNVVKYNEIVQHPQTGEMTSILVVGSNIPMGL